MVLYLCIKNQNNLLGLVKKMKSIKNILTTILGTVFTALGISLFLSPNKIVSGGVSGISIMLYNLFSVPMGISFAVINLILLLFGLKILGKEFIIKTLIGAGSLSVFIEIFAFLPPATDNVFIATVFGGTLYGVGIGIALVSGASTGGGDIIGRIIQYKFESFPIGKILLAIDVTIIGASFFAFDDINLVFFGIISMFISSYMIDYIIQRLNVSRLALVITDRGQEISKKIVSSSPRGVTIIDGKGGYTNNDKNVLVCAMKENEAPGFQDKVTKIDPNSFVIFVESQRILGNGFYIYH